MSIEKKEVAGLYLVDNQDLPYGLDFCKPPEWVLDSISKEKWAIPLKYFRYSEGGKDIIVIASCTHMDDKTRAAIPYFEAVQAIKDAENEKGGEFRLTEYATHIIAPILGDGIFEPHIATCYQAPEADPVVFDPKVNDPTILLGAAPDSLNSGLKKAPHIVRGIFRTLFNPTYREEVDVFEPVDLYVLSQDTDILNLDLVNYKNSYVFTNDSLYYVYEADAGGIEILKLNPADDNDKEWGAGIDLQKPGKISLSYDQIETLRETYPIEQNAPISVQYETLGTQSVWDPMSCGFHFFANARVMANLIQDGQPVSREALLNATKDNPQLTIEAKAQLNNAKLDAADNLEEAENRKEEGCTLHLMEEMPKDLTGYEGSYILTDTELRYVRVDKNFPVPTQTANIDENIATFKKNLANSLDYPINLQNDSLDLTSEQITQLIQSNVKKEEGQVPPPPPHQQERSGAALARREYIKTLKKEANTHYMAFLRKAWYETFRPKTDDPEQTKTFAEYFLGWPKQSGVAAKIAYVALLGWVFTPVINLFKLPELLFKTLAETFNFFRHQLYQSCPANTPLQYLRSAALGLTHLGYGLFAGLHLLTRTVCSPINSAKAGFSKNKALGVLSIVTSAVLISALIVLALPLAGVLIGAKIAGAGAFLAEVAKVPILSYLAVPATKLLTALGLASTPAFAGAATLTVATATAVAINSARNEASVKVEKDEDKKPPRKEALDVESFVSIEKENLNTKASLIEDNLSEKPEYGPIGTPIINKNLQENSDEDEDYDDDIVYERDIILDDTPLNVPYDSPIFGDFFSSTEQKSTLTQEEPIPSSSTPSLTLSSNDEENN